MAEETRMFHFHSDAVADDTFQVASITGVESLSTPYSFEFDLVSKKADVPLDKILTSKAHLAIRQSIPVSGGKHGTRLYKMHGIVSTFEVLEKVHDWIKYRAILVPRLWKCSLTTQCRVFQDADIKDLIKQVLTDPDGPGLAASDFEVKAKGPFTKREFVVQYNESDLEFLHRWMEHEGVFYYFDQTESGEKIIFADDAAHYGTLPGDPKIPYRPDPATRSRAAGATSEETMQEQSVHSLRCRMKKTTKQVVLNDYNYRTPSVDIKATYDVKNNAGEGKLYVYGEHFKTASEGKAIAKVRGEEIQCRDKVFDGTGDHRSFRPGSKFNLSEHYRADFNATYLLTHISHKVTQGTGVIGATGGNMTYVNEFHCIPADDVFRPERVTPWPSIHGFINAKVDAGGSGQYAEIDDQGRYKVKMPFDLSDKKDGKASRFVRMAQPYAGANMGMHFPLHKNTEVLLSFIDGDPDRPIIASAIPNAETTGPVTSSNQSQCAIQTGGGNKMVIEDTDGTQRIKMSTPHATTFFQMGSPNADGEGAVLGTAADIIFDSAREYRRTTGGNVVIEQAKNEHKITKGNSSSETQGNSRTWTKGDSETEVVGNSKSTVTGNSESKVTGNSKSTVIGDAESKTVGSTTSTFIGSTMSKSLATTTEFFAGNKNSACAAVTADVFVGAKMGSTNAISVEANTGGKVLVCDASELKTANQRLEEATGPHKIVGGTIEIDSTGTLVLDASTSISIKCGGSEIKMSSSEIMLKSPTIKFDASGSLEGKSGGTLKLNGSMLDVSGQTMHK
jgi:type VI secretion system secreted protein VgrG